MRLLSVHQRALVYSTSDEADQSLRLIRTGIAPLDSLLPGGGWAMGTVHELLVRPGHPPPLVFASILMRAVAQKMNARSLIWCDPTRRIHIPALVQMGLNPDRLLRLSPCSEKDALWSLEQAMRCKAVGAVIGEIGAVTQVQARRLRLAAETGGGIGIWMRETGRASAQHAATTRWRIESVPGDAFVQRFEVELLHGHGGRVGSVVHLEVDRESHSVRATDELANRPLLPQPAVASA